VWISLKLTTQTLHALVMELPSLRRIQQLLLLNRAALTFVAVAFIIWAVGSGFHKGTPVLFSARSLHVGEVIRAADVVVTYIEGAQLTYLSNVDDVVGKVVSSDIEAGAPLRQSHFSTHAADDTRIHMTLSLDQSDPAQYAPGTRVHVWRLSDEFAELVSTDAIVVRATRSNVGSNSVTLSLLREDESAVVQSAAVRLVTVG